MKYRLVCVSPTSHSKMWSLNTLCIWSQYASAIILCEAHNCNDTVSCSLSHYICIVLTLVSAYSPSLLTPLSQSIHCKSLPQAAISANTIPPALPCSSKVRETAVYTGAGLQGEQEGGGGREGEARLNGKARDGGQGRGRFFGKGANPITGSGAALVSLAALNSHFNSLFLPPPVPSSFSFYLCLFLLLFFLIFSHPGSPSHPLTVHPSRSPSICLSRLPKRGGGMKLYHQKSFKSCHPIAVSC